MRFLIISVFLFQALGCASVSVSPRGVPPVTGPSPEPLEAQGPQISEAIKPLILVLSPGRALGFSHVGVLRGLAEARIPVSAVLATEMGGLVGALYAATGTVQKFEWGLLRFKEDVFSSKGGLLGLFSGAKSESSDGQKLEKALQQTFGAQDIREVKVPLRLFAKRKGGGAEALILMNGGPLRLAVRATLATPGLFEPSMWEGQKTESAGEFKPYPVAEAQELFPGAVILVVDALPEPERAEHANQRERADFVVRPDFNGLTPADFGKRNEIAFRGKAAVSAIVPQLRKALGLPEFVAAPERGEEE